TAKDREARFRSMAAFATALVEATQTPDYVAAVDAAASAPAAAPAEAAPGGTWIRGPGARAHRPVTPPVGPPRGDTAVIGAEPSGMQALALPATEAPPPGR